MTEEKVSPTKEARAFVGDGRLRQVLGNCGYTISEEAIDKIIDACSFVLKV